ncbi:PH domain-containing protein [bacterium]|nr:MAG: PH domain-containing protein [bacterium]
MEGISMWDIDTKHLQSDEIIEFQDKPSVMSCIFSYVWIGLMLLSFIALLSMQSKDEMRGMPLVYLVLASPAIYIVFSRLSTRYALTNRGLLTRTGIITTSVKSVPFKFVTSTEIKETIIGKIFNYASVIIDTAGSGKSIEVDWKYLRSAHRVKKLIDGKISAQIA